MLEQNTLLRIHSYRFHGTDTERRIVKEFGTNDEGAMA
jgi:hypothetical protein